MLCGAWQSIVAVKCLSLSLLLLEIETRTLFDSDAGGSCVLLKYQYLPSINQFIRLSARKHCLLGICIIAKVRDEILLLYLSVARL